jgi:protein-tyrosine phosphatase
MAAALLSARAQTTGVPVTVVSGGFGPTGLPAVPEAIEAMMRIGTNIAGHRSHQLVTEDCEAADLVVGMTKQHAMELAVLAPAAWPRIFTLVELAGRAAKVGPRRPGEEGRAWVARVHGDRTPSDVIRLPSRDDIGDPVGCPLPVVEQARDRMARLAGDVIDLIGPGDAPDGGPTGSTPIAWSGWDT